MTATIFVNGHQNTLDMISTDLENLYYKIIAPLAKQVGGNFAEVSKVDLWSENFHLSHLNADDFNYAYQLISKTCQDDSTLIKYQPKIDELFKADPRYTP